MVERKMMDVAVSHGEEGHILIRQECFQSPEGEMTIVLHPSQIDLLTQWLLEAKREALAERGETSRA